jgi:hypothetical protein
LEQYDDGVGVIDGRSLEPELRLLVALSPGTNFEGQSVEMNEPKNGDWTINAGWSGHPSLSCQHGEFYDWVIAEMSSRALCIQSHLEQ